MKERTPGNQPQPLARGKEAPIFKEQTKEEFLGGVGEGGH